MTEKLKKRLLYRNDLCDRMRLAIEKIEHDVPVDICPLLVEATDTIMNMENEMAMLRAKLEGKMQ